jgi:integrase
VALERPGVRQPVAERPSRQSDAPQRAGATKGGGKGANEALAQDGIEPISERVTPHSLRRTYASVRAALRDDPVYIAEQLGHRDARFTFRVFRWAAKRRERMTGEHLAAAFDRALDRAELGRKTAPNPSRGDRPIRCRRLGTALRS